MDRRMEGGKKDRGREEGIDGWMGGWTDEMVCASIRSTIPVQSHLKLRVLNMIKVNSENFIIVALDMVIH